MVRTHTIACLAAVATAACGCGRQATVHRTAAAVLGPYSGSVEAGETVFVSGKIGRTGGTFAEEVETAIAAVAGELARAGLELRDVVSVTVYLTDLDRYDELNRIYARRFPAPYPARACVEVARLPGSARVEIQAVARRR